MVDQNWVVYCLVCGDGSFYVGATNDLTKRVRAHRAGKGARYTRGRLPIKVVTVSSEHTKSEALKLEARVKKLPRRMKPLAIAERMIPGIR